MSADRRLAVLLLAAVAAAVFAACSDDDPTGPGGCADLVFDDILPTDEDGNAIGAGGEGDWCWPEAGSNPAEPYLYPAFPNPFNPATTIKFALPERAVARIRIVDDRCRTVRTLFEAERDFGQWEVVWNGADEGGTRQRDGLYGVILEVGDFRCAGVIELRSTP